MAAQAQANLGMQDESASVASLVFSHEAVSSPSAAQSPHGGPKAGAVRPTGSAWVLSSSPQHGVATRTAPSEAAVGSGSGSGGGMRLHAVAEGGASADGARGSSAHRRGTKDKEHSSSSHRRHGSHKRHGRHSHHKHRHKRRHKHDRHHHKAASSAASSRGDGRGCVGVAAVVPMALGVHFALPPPMIRCRSPTSTISQLSATPSIQRLRSAPV